MDAEGQEGGGGEEEEEVQGDSDRCVDVCMDAARGGGAEGLRTRKEVVEWYRAIREEARQVDGGGEEWLPADGGVEGGAVERVARALGLRMVVVREGAGEAGGARMVGGEGRGRRGRRGRRWCC